MHDLRHNLKRSSVLALKRSKALSALACRVVQWTGKSPYPVHPKHLVDVVEPWYLAHLRKNDRVLDLGCANGQHTLRAAPRVRAIVGMDYDERLLAVARADAARRGVKNATFQTGNVEERLPFPDASFDVILFLDVLEHLRQRDTAMREAHRVLRRGGKLLLAVPNSETSWKRLQESVGLSSFSDPDHKIEYTRSEILAECTKHGFSVVQLMPIVYDVWYVGLIDLLGGFSLSLYQKIGRWKYQYAQEHPAESIGFEIVAVKS